MSLIIGSYLYDNSTEILAKNCNRTSNILCITHTFQCKLPEDSIKWGAELKAYIKRRMLLQY